MAFVQVVGGDRKTERPKYSLSADAENDLLLDAVRLASPIEPVGDGTVARIVLRHIGVQENDRHLPSQRRF